MHDETWPNRPVRENVRIIVEGTAERKRDFMGVRRLLGREKGG